MGAANDHQSSPVRAVTRVPVEEHFVTTRYGIEIDTREPVWCLDGRKTVNVAAVRDVLQRDLLQGFNGTIRQWGRRKSHPYIHNTLRYLVHYQRSIFPKGLIKRWHSDDLLAYRKVLLCQFGNEDRLNHIRPFLKSWRALRLPGVTKEVVDLLSGMTLKLHEVGEKVRRNDPNDGPLTEGELQNLTLDVFAAAEEGRINLEALSLVRFFSISGRRATQAVDLKCKDVARRGIREHESDPVKAGTQYLLLVPRAKQGGGFREKFRAIDLRRADFILFETVSEMARTAMADLVHKHGFDLQAKDVDFLGQHLPLYPSWQKVQDSVRSAGRLREKGRHAEALATLRTHAEGRGWHRLEGSVVDRLGEVARAAGARSRDGGELRITTTRLRYTLGTGLARRGIGADVIAYLLDHTNLESAQIYVDNLPERAAIISDAMREAPLMAKVVKLFKGNVVDAEADAIGGEDPLASRIHYKGEGAATCGTGKRCGLRGGIPKACYTCNRFQPWLNGPHEALLSELLAERKKDAGEFGFDHPYTQRQDETIAAVINVIQICDARREEIRRGEERPQN